MGGAWGAPLHIRGARPREAEAAATSTYMGLVFAMGSQTLAFICLFLVRFGILRGWSLRGRPGAPVHISAQRICSKVGRTTRDRHSCVIPVEIT